MGIKYLNRETNRIAFFNTENAEGFIDFESIYNAMNNTSTTIEELCDIVLNRVKICLIRRNNNLGYRVFYNLGDVNNKEDWKMDLHRTWMNICSIRKNSLTLEEFIEAFVNSITSLKVYINVEDGEYGLITYKKLFEEESLELVKCDVTPKATERFAFATWEQPETEQATANRPIYRYTPYDIDYNTWTFGTRRVSDFWEEITDEVCNSSSTTSNATTAAAGLSTATTTNNRLYHSVTPIEF